MNTASYITVQMEDGFESNGLTALDNTDLKGSSKGNPDMIVQDSAAEKIARGREYDAANGAAWQQFHDTRLEVQPDAAKLRVSSGTQIVMSGADKGQKYDG